MAIYTVEPTDNHLYPARVRGYPPVPYVLMIAIICDMIKTEISS